MVLWFAEADIIGTVLCGQRGFIRFMARSQQQPQKSFGILSFGMTSLNCRGFGMTSLRRMSTTDGLRRQRFPSARQMFPPSPCFWICSRHARHVGPARRALGLPASGSKVEELFSFTPQVSFTPLVMCCFKNVCVCVCVCVGGVQASV